MVAAAAAAGIVSSNAQVYSVNAVGYVNKTIPKGGFALVSNPLKAATNTIAALFGGQVPNSTQIFVYDTTAKTFKFTAYDTDFGWDPQAVADLQVLPGGGVFVKNNSTADAVVTFVGEVPQGTLTTSLIAGLQIVSSQVPQAGTVEALGYVADGGDQIYQWNLAGQKYDFFQYDADFKSWDPTLKTLDVGDAFFLSKTKAGTWTRTFSVNQ